MARADVCFVGGSLVPVGGHNILEPAALGVPVLFGPRMENFRDARDAVLAAEGGCEVAGADDLCRRVVDLLRDPDRRRRMGEAGRHVVSANAGAAKANLDRVARLLAR
jgi:3-deoxy-D-manno-octulosonic-acid transferase